MMTLNQKIITVIYMLLFLASTTIATDFDIQKYGARLNTDITKALSDAWKDACASPISSKIIIPVGTYTLTEARLQGPCKAPIELNVQATLQPSTSPSSGKNWITLEYIDMLTLSGSGVFDGKGETVWGKTNGCGQGNYCKKLSINMVLNFVNNSIIQDVTSLNSKQFHVMVFGCNNVTFHHFTVTAPAESLNTDGIHIGHSTNINVTNSKIGTGDDCVSIGDGSKQIFINNVTCGPGHGISVGSLGKYPNEEPVQGITVLNCTFTNTANGIRVKTWPASFPGIVSDLHYEDLIMENVGNPIFIDQEYCPWNQCSLGVPSKVKISNLSIKNVRGTSSTPMALKLSCSQEVPCEGVEITDMNLIYNGNEGPITSQCKEVKPIIKGIQNPIPCSTRA